MEPVFDEFEFNEVFGNYNLFYYCNWDIQPEHPYQFKIALNKAFETETSNLLKVNARLATERLKELSFDVGQNFCYWAFLYPYHYGWRINFLNFQFEKTSKPRTFLYRVNSLLQQFDWNGFGEDFSYNHLIEQEVNNWLSKKLEQLEPSNLIPVNKEVNPTTISQTIPKLNTRQIALLCSYLERRVTQINAREIAKDYGVETTGNKLYQFFSFYNDRRHRINMVEGSTVDTTYEKKIELLESVIELLGQNTPAKDRAIDELKLLKAIKD